MRKAFVIAILGLVILLLAGYIGLLGFASRAQTPTVFSFSYAPDASLLVLIGPQSVCPPFVQCPQITQNPKAISAWIISNAPPERLSPLWQTYATLQHRKLLYILTP